VPPGAAPFLNSGGSGVNDSAAQAAQQARIDAVFASAGATTATTAAVAGAATNAPTSTYSNAHLRPSFEKVRLSSRGLRDHSSYENHNANAGGGDGEEEHLKSPPRAEAEAEDENEDEEYGVNETGDGDADGSSEVPAGQFQGSESHIRGGGNDDHNTGLPPAVDVSNISFESGKSGGGPLSSNLDPRLRAAYGATNQEPTFEHTSDAGSDDENDGQRGDVSQHNRSDTRGRPLERPPHSPHAHSSPQPPLPPGQFDSNTASTSNTTSSSSNVPRFEQLYAQHAASAKKAREKKAQAEAAQVAACTFAPIFATRDRSGSRDRSASRGRGSANAKVDSNNHPRRRSGSSRSSRDDNAAMGTEGPPRTSPLHDKVADLIAKRRARSTSATPPVLTSSSSSETPAAAVPPMAAGNNTAEGAVKTSPTVNGNAKNHAGVAKNSEEEDDDESKEGDVASVSEGDDSNDENERNEEPDLANAHNKEFARGSDLKENHYNKEDEQEDEDRYSVSMSTSNRMTPVNSDEESDTDSSLPAHLLSGGLQPEEGNEVPRGGSSNNSGSGKKGGFLNRMKQDLARRNARAAER